MTAYFNLNNNEIPKELLVIKFNNVLDNQGRLMLNDQKIPLPNKPQRSPGSGGVLLKKVFLKSPQISHENTCVGVSF